MARHIITGIDVGTNSTRVVISEYTKERPMPRILGVGLAESRGLRHGYITNRNEAAKSIRQALRSAEKAAGVRVKNAGISIGGISLESMTSTGQTMISRADNEVSELDIEKAYAIAEEALGNIANKKILETIPLKYKIDGTDVWGHPEGMKGSRLEVKMLFITCLAQHVDELVQTVEDAGVEVEYVVPSPLAASLVALSKKQRTVGCVLTNIGAETVSIIVFEDDIPLSIQVFPIGSTDITNDIALGFQIPLDEAEDLKVGRKPSALPKKKLDDIIDARLSDIFELIEAHLKKIGRSGLLPAGIVLTGGGAGISTIEDLARGALKLPSSIASPVFGSGQKEYVRDSSWFVAYGLCIFGATQHRRSGSFITLPRSLKQKVVTWLKQLLP